MIYEFQLQLRSDDWAATADLTTLRQHLLDLLCQLAYQETSFSLQAAQFLLHGGAGTSTLKALLQQLVAFSYPSCRQMSRQLLDWHWEQTQLSALWVFCLNTDRYRRWLFVKNPRAWNKSVYWRSSLPAGSLVVVLEDVVTTGQSALKAVERLRQAGYSVNQVMALVDRQGAELYQSAGLQFQSVFSIQELQERSRQG